ncbi:unnamed protein product [Ceutorhynchus assimilis]|uniref:uS12 prolyl 3-hydroxylase n=1 Tax=Ceutorhynchus assimilis TaxID=467358 RepID=A0A9N9MFP5_9CUCU|nr:unnamed protein product [Ceutorhynchus assimilis]
MNSEEEEICSESSSESEPELECDQWDSDCKILPLTTVSCVTGRHLMPTCTALSQKRFRRCFTIRSEISQASIKNNYKADKQLKSDNFELIIQPFKVCVINNFIENFWIEKFVTSLYDLDFNLRHLDLYEFFQSRDLKHYNSDTMVTFYKFLIDDVKQWVSAIIDTDLTDVSVTCSLYTNTDYLLVHDDQKDDRKIAFILYLTDENEGGALQLIGTDSRGHPNQSVKNLWPRANQFVFFPVTNRSYHRVSEIVGLNKYRLSINGWFHTKSPEKFEAPLYKPQGLFADTYSSPKTIDIDLKSWINIDYLSPKSIQLIQNHVEENSEISLKNFLKLEPFQAIIAQLGNIDWAKRGPINRLNYDVAASKLPHPIERLLDLFQSNQMFALLHQYTQLDLVKVKTELQRWTPDNYELLNDYDWSKNELDLTVYFGCQNPRNVIGARTHYVTIEDEVQNALITIEPVENVLNLVYRDSARFTKYFSAQSECKCFYKLICCYSE